MSDCCSDDADNTDVDDDESPPKSIDFIDCRASPTDTSLTVKRPTGNLFGWYLGCGVIPYDIPWSDKRTMLTMSSMLAFRSLDRETQFIVQTPFIV